VADYPELADDISAVDQVVTPAFHDADLSALRHQNRYRRQQVVIIVGSALLTGLGGLQAVFPGEKWPGLLLALLGALLAVLSNAVNELSALENFMTERVKAERLRSACFRFLSGTGRYAGADRVSVLRRAVLSIRAAHGSAARCGGPVGAAWCGCGRHANAPVRPAAPVAKEPRSALPAPGRRSADRRDRAVASAARR
jgi:hypothetical protein